MSDLIRRADAMRVIKDDWDMSFSREDFERAQICQFHFMEISNIPTVEPKVGEWIPCEERLPNETKARYLICTDDGYMCMCRWTNVNIFWTNIPTDWHWNLYDVPQYSKVVAWMPIKPYKMERGE